VVLVVNAPPAPIVVELLVGPVASVVLPAEPLVDGPAEPPWPLPPDPPLGCDGPPLSEKPQAATAMLARAPSSGAATWDRRRWDSRLV